MILKAEIFDLKHTHGKTYFVLFPAIAMMLGWGLRGSIGGGPFGAMIPGAMVALCLAALLKLPLKTSPAFVVFGVIGIGLGGEMTYGQTIGFLRSPETMWWGTLGLTVKGAIWGLLGGIVLGFGLSFKRMKTATVITGFILLLAGMLAGFKLINQPMLIYFSDRANPRPESWAALLSGALFLIAWLMVKLDNVSFRIVWKFALFGLIGGGIGFGGGGLWNALGNHLGNTVIFREWWKAMEFSFGGILGAFFGLAAWFSRKEISYITGYPDGKQYDAEGSMLKEIIVAGITGTLIFLVFAAFLDPIVEAIPKGPRSTMVDGSDMAILFSNYAFYGLIMVLAVILFPWSAWQIAITLTFSHTIIDLAQNMLPEGSSGILKVLFILIPSLIAAILTSQISRGKNVISGMLILLTWSTTLVEFVKFTYDKGFSGLAGLSISEIIPGKLFVILVFLFTAIGTTWMACKTSTN
jgi:hypothetical protein